MSKILNAVFGCALLSACGGAGSAVSVDASDAIADASLTLASGPETSDVLTVEDADFASILNGLRLDRGLEGFTYDSRLDAAAQKHAEDMVDRGYFAHQTLGTGENVYDRIVAEGYDPRGWAENLAQGQQTQEAALEAWINSASHNANLNASLEEFAIGAAGSGSELTWVLVLATEN